MAEPLPYRRVIPSTRCQNRVRAVERMLDRQAGFGLPVHPMLICVGIALTMTAVYMLVILVVDLI